MAYFGTNGVRGRFDELSPELALKLAQAIGLYFKTRNTKRETNVLVARDCRLTGEILKDAVISGLASAGCEVIDIDIASSPTAEFMVRRLKAAGCVIVSASHNPPEWNALKVIDGKGVAISKERGAEIENRLEKIELAQWDKVGKITKYEMATADHIEAIAKLMDKKAARKKPKKIVLDCGNGTACLIAPKLFKELGCDILTINSHPDGRFPGRPSEPTEANVKELISLVKSSKADAGVAWDGDGDRVIFVDEKGNYVIGDKVYALSIIWKSIEGGKNKLNGDIVTTVATSRAVEDVAGKYGAKVRYTAIGAPYLTEDMIRKPAILGGEEVGGVIWPELSLAKDGFLTAAKMAEAISIKPLSEWLKEVPVYCNVKTKVEAEEKKKKEIVSKAKEYAKKQKLDFVDVDGIRINFKDSWVIVRASGTENYVRIFAEARTRKQAEMLVREYERIAKGI
jgi:phosphomannomutase/phosphoglucomutase